TILKALRPDCGGGGTGCTGGNLMPRPGSGRSRTKSSDSGPTSSTREGTVFVGSIVDASLGFCVSRTRRGAYCNGPSVPVGRCDASFIDLLLHFDFDFDSDSDVSDSD